MSEKLTRAQQKEKSKAESAAKNDMARKAKKRKVLIQIGFLAGLIAVGGIIFVSLASQKPPVSQANPVNLLSDGIVLTQSMDVVNTPAIANGDNPTPTVTADGKVKLDIYVDYLCPFCKKFETAQEGIIKKYIESGDVQVEFHPLAMLSEYSAITANASACVAGLDSKKWWNVNYIMYANQPDENSARQWAKKDSIKYVTDMLSIVGLNSEALDCIKNVPYYDWSINATEQAANGPLPYAGISKIQGTPTIIINGAPVADVFTDSTILDKALAEAVAAKKQ